MENFWQVGEVDIYWPIALLIMDTLPLKRIWNPMKDKLLLAVREMK